MCCRRWRMYCSADSETTFWISCTHQSARQWADFTDLRRIYNSRFWERCGFTLGLSSSQGEGGSCIFSSLVWFTHRALYLINCFVPKYLVDDKFLGVLPVCWSWRVDLLICEVKDLLERLGQGWWLWKSCSNSIKRGLHPTNMWGGKYGQGNTKRSVEEERERSWLKSQWGEGEGEEVRRDGVGWRICSIKQLLTAALPSAWAAAGKRRRRRIFAFLDLTFSNDFYERFYFSTVNDDQGHISWWCIPRDGFMENIFYFLHQFSTSCAMH